ncbi:SMI1/KNR4 family protein [Erwinia sp. J316]|uniref:SMI1/KNR4 family protein n=2 Tax=Erwinia sorbitola TaxID=2681984 RepID=A0A6I6EZV8_9GAMM|nr:SMI1/KNR4 family protein [Erwinia sorbitola]QGU89733.1 SMI1/KNR4 family protein [Erwinia sorbitola]
MLIQKNGCYGFVSALHIFPWQATDSEHGLQQWNQPELWIDAFQDMARDALFFAEDIFGVQFCLRQDGVFSFEPETGEFSWLAASLEHWSALILEEYSVLTGYPLAQDWQDQHGALPAGCRLVPKTPFIAGGEFVPENLHAVRSEEGMRSRAQFAVQIRNLPDGTRIAVTPSDPEE